MKIPKLFDVDSSRGAPMGRANILPVDATPYKFLLQRLAFIDGAYDIGGAYWGSPENVWRAVTPEAHHPWRSNWDGTPQDDEQHLEVFVRADTYDQACHEVLALVPHAAFYPEQKFLPQVERTIAELLYKNCDGFPKCDKNFKRFQAMTPILEQLDEFTAAYIEAALWTEEERLTEERRRPEGCRLSDPDPEACTMADLSLELLQRMVQDCQAFQAANDLTDYPARNAGHDFWLSRNGHGAGFFDCDHGTEEQCGKLQNAARACKQCDIYLGDDKLIYA